MLTKLDQAVFRLIESHPGWVDSLSPVDRQIVSRRRAGATFREIALDFALTPTAVRLRLYGAGSGLRRHGGIYGKLQGMELRKRVRGRGA